MKHVKYIFAIVVILVLAIVFIRSNKNPVTPIGTPTSGDIDLSPEVNATQLCFIWNTEAGDKAQLSMDLRGSNVIGEFNWLPAEKDKKTGIFKGTVSAVDPYSMSRTINAIWETHGEGQVVNEELKIIFGEGTASPGFGAMKDRGDGTYVYADPENISYDLNLSDTDCGDEAMD